MKEEEDELNTPEEAAKSLGLGVTVVAEEGAAPPQTQRKRVWNKRADQLWEEKNYRGYVSRARQEALDHQAKMLNENKPS